MSEQPCKCLDEVVKCLKECGCRAIKGRLKYLSDNESTQTSGIGTSEEECGAEEEGREGELEGEGAYMDVRLFTLALTETSVVALGGTCTGVCRS